MFDTEASPGTALGGRLVSGRGNGKVGMEVKLSPNRPREVGVLEVGTWKDEGTE